MYRQEIKLNLFKKKIAYLIMFICAVLILSGCKKDGSVSILTENVLTENSATDLKGDEEIITSIPNGIYVYITGEVKNPGVYNVVSDARLFQVIDMAGGMTKNARKNYLNLAQNVTDGQQIRVLSKKEYKALMENESMLGNADLDKGMTSGTESVAVNINSATSQDLQTLSGIGATRAQAIIDYRQTNGSFSSIEDIKNVSGIGDSTFEKIKTQITVD